MKTIRQMSERTQDELTRLHRLEIAAWETGQIETAVTCRLRWVDLYRATDGCSSPQPRLIVQAGGTLQGRRVGSARAWREKQNARPLVAVKKSREVVWADSGGGVHAYYVLTLACGHEVEDYNISPDGKEAKRRRCHACGDAILEASKTGPDEITLESTAENVECPSYDKFRLA